MTYEQLRRCVIGKRYNTLMCLRFREAFGIAAHVDAGTTITAKDYRKRTRRREIMDCMAHRYGALDRGTP